MSVFAVVAGADAARMASEGIELATTEEKRKSRRFTERWRVVFNALRRLIGGLTLVVATTCRQTPGSEQAPEFREIHCNSRSRGGNLSFVDSWLLN